MFASAKRGNDFLCNGGLQILVLVFSSAQMSGSCVLVGSDTRSILSSLALLLTIFTRSQCASTNIYCPLGNVEPSYDTVVV